MTSGWVYIKPCTYCQGLPDGPMLVMGQEMAHYSCVKRELDQLVDPEYKAPAARVGVSVSMPKYVNARILRPLEVGLEVYKSANKDTYLDNFEGVVVGKVREWDDLDCEVVLYEDGDLILADVEDA